MQGLKSQLSEAYYQNKPEFNSIYSKIKLPSTKDEKYVLELELELIGLLDMLRIIKWAIVIVLVFNTFQKRLKML